MLTQWHSGFEQRQLYRLGSSVAFLEKGGITLYVVILTQMTGYLWKLGLVPHQGPDMMVAYPPTQRLQLW